MRSKRSKFDSIWEKIKGKTLPINPYQQHTPSNIRDKSMIQRLQDKVINIVNRTTRVKKQRWCTSDITPFWNEAKDIRKGKKMCDLRIPTSKLSTKKHYDSRSVEGKW